MLATIGLDAPWGSGGAGLSLYCSHGLVKTTGCVLCDAEKDAPVVDEIREVIAGSTVPAEITDLHVWRVASGKYACILGLTVSGPAAPEAFRRQLAVHEELVHITVELNSAIA